MTRVPRPATVVAGAVLALVDAALLLTGLVALLVNLGRLSLTRPGSLTGSTLVGLAGAAVLVPLVLAVLMVVGAVGVLRGRRAARVLLTVVAAVLVVQAVVGVVTAAARPAGPAPLVLVGLALSLAVLVLTWLPASRAWFAPPVR